MHEVMPDYEAKGTSPVAIGLRTVYVATAEPRSSVSVRKLRHTSQVSLRLCSASQGKYLRDHAHSDGEPVHVVAQMDSSSQAVCFGIPSVAVVCYSA
jgi:hypothetical protein